MSMSMLTPADAIVGAAIALAAMHKPRNNAFREALIKHSFLNARPKLTELYASTARP
jgi:hypothetical protein